MDISKEQQVRKAVQGLQNATENFSNVLHPPVPIAELANDLADGKFRAGVIGDIIRVEARTPAVVPLVSGSVACGFPSPADDHMEGILDFNELLVRNPPATFVARVRGDSMIGAGIFSGDLAVVDKSASAVDGSIIVALINGEFTLKRFKLRRGQVVLEADNPRFSNMVVPEDSQFEIWGVVKYAIRML